MYTTTEYEMDKRLKNFYQDALSAFGAYFPTEEENVGEKIADYCGVHFYIDRLTENERRMDTIPVREENEAGEPSSYLETRPFEFIQLLAKLYDSYHYEGKDWKNLESQSEEIKNHLFKKYYFEKYGYEALQNSLDNRLPADNIMDYRIHSLLREIDQLWDFYPLNLDCSNMKYQHTGLTCEFASLPDQHSYCARFLGITDEGKPSVHQFHTIYSSNLEEELQYLNQICNYPVLNTDCITLEYNYSDGGDNSLSFSQLNGDYISTVRYDLVNDRITSSQRFKNKETSSTHKATMEDKFAICQMLEKVFDQKNNVEYNEHVKGLKK